MEYEFKSRAQVVFSYGRSQSPFGKVFVVLLDRSFVHLSFLDNLDDERSRLAYAASCLKTFYPFARFCEEDVDLIVKKSFEIYMRGKKVPNILLVGSSFYERVWHSVCRIEFGKTAFYEEISYGAGFQNSPRMCGQIIGNNPIACFVPCHRVISRSKEETYYRWGKDRQKMLLEFESEFLTSNLRKQRTKDVGACSEALKQPRARS